MIHAGSKICPVSRENTNSNFPTPIVRPTFYEDMESPTLVHILPAKIKTSTSLRSPCLRARRPGECRPWLHDAVVVTHFTLFNYRTRRVVPNLIARKRSCQRQAPHRRETAKGGQQRQASVRSRPSTSPRAPPLVTRDNKPHAKRALIPRSRESFTITLLSSSSSTSNRNNTSPPAGDRRAAPF